MMAKDIPLFRVLFGTRYPLFLFLGSLCSSTMHSLTVCDLEVLCTHILLLLRTGSPVNAALCSYDFLLLKKQTS